MYSYGPPYMAGQKQDNQLEHTFSSYVRIQDVTLKTYQRRWTIARSGERGSGIFVLAARHDDDDDIGNKDVISLLRQNTFPPCAPNTSFHATAYFFSWPLIPTALFQNVPRWKESLYVRRAQYIYYLPTPDWVRVSQCKLFLASWLMYHLVY